MLYFSSYKSARNGFTFLEAMIAMVLLIVGIVTVLQIFPLAFGIGISNQKETQATMLCQEKIEEINSKNYREIQVGIQTEDPLPSPFEKFSRETKVSYVDNNLQATTSDTGLKKVEVEVWWSSFFPAGKKQIKVTTLIAEK